MSHRKLVQIDHGADGLRKCAWKAFSRNVQSHNGVNLPCSIIREILSPVGLIFGSVANVEKCFANNSDDRRISDAQLLSRASMKRESGSRPTKNYVANLTPLRFRWYFSNDEPRFVSGRILKCNVKITVRFDFESNYAARKRKPFIFTPGA